MANVMVVEVEPEVLSVLVDLIRERGHEAVGVQRTSQASGLANVINPRAAQYLGIRAMHTKPFEMTALLNEIDSVLGRG